MRLKTKILLSVFSFIVAAVALCCILILRVVRDQMQSDAVESAEKDMDSFIQRNMRDVEPYHDRMLCDSYMIYWVRQDDKASEFTLYNGEKYLINNAELAPERYLPVPDPDSIMESRSGCYRINSVVYVITGIRMYYQEYDYSICLVRNISFLDQKIRKISVQCGIIGTIVTVCSLILTYFLLSFSLRPITQLNKGAKAIAAGDYHTRIPIHRKDEVGLLAEEFNTMAEAVESSIASLREQNARKQLFINDLSHEMKTPVTSLLINSETLLTRHIGEEDAAHVYYRIHEQAKWIERLSQKLMQLVLMQDVITLTPCPVTDLFEAVSLTVHDSLELANVSLQTICRDEAFSMNFDLMQSALVNLIENAIKASAPGSTIELISQNNEIIVRDHGKGIPKNEIDRITEPFYMIDRSRSKKLGGSGLGLALVKRITEVHHAELHIESEVNKGTSIFFRFSDAV